MKTQIKFNGGKMKKLLISLILLTLVLSISVIAENSNAFCGKKWTYWGTQECSCPNNWKKAVMLNDCIYRIICEPMENGGCFYRYERECYYSYKCEKPKLR